ncbi:MAG: sn-glycerol-3-phosphate ABC transporter ATP-binding protein UgpC [Pseudomonadota bacterium]
MAGLELTDVHKAYGPVEVIHGVDLTIPDGAFTVFVGPSGCGKSTLLRMVAGLEEISSGTLQIGGRTVNDVEAAQRGVAMVFQTYALYPHMTVAENMGFGLKMNGVPKADIDARVAEASNILKLDPYLKRKPKALSGGQRQRVAIGRAIVREPEVFLFDEPLSNLDAELRVAMRVEIARLHQEIGATMIYVTHDQVEAMTLADQIVVLRDGRIEQVGAPLDLYDDPDNLFVAGFIGSPRMNFMAGRVVSSDGAASVVEVPEHAFTIAVPLAETPAPGMEVTVGVRPEHFADGGSAEMDLKVDVVEHLGGASFIYAEAAGGEARGATEEPPLVIESRDARGVREGEVFRVSFDPARALLFETQGGRRLR